MILIADSGSTKTHWILMSQNGKQQSFYSQGINPYFLDETVITELVSECFQSVNGKNISQVYFYGAGCSLPEKCSLVHGALQFVFPKAAIETKSDLLAAAYALFGDHEGVACILGTGSNAAVYDGKDFSSKIQSLGYLLGDEGSGSYIGRMILQSYLRNEMPHKLRLDFEKKYQVDVASILENLYKKEFPNRYLATYAPFATKFAKEVFIKKIIKTAFKNFIKYQLDTLSFNKKIPVGFVGSVAYYFQDILKEELENRSYIIGEVIQEPIHSLVKYLQ